MIPALVLCCARLCRVQQGAEGCTRTCRQVLIRCCDSLLHDMSDCGGPWAATNRHPEICVLLAWPSPWRQQPKALDEMGFRRSQPGSPDAFLSHSAAESLLGEHDISDDPLPALLGWLATFNVRNLVVVACQYTRTTFSSWPPAIVPGRNAKPGSNMNVTPVAQRPEPRLQPPRVARGLMQALRGSLRVA